MHDICTLYEFLSPLFVVDYGVNDMEFQVSVRFTLRVGRVARFHDFAAGSTCMTPSPYPTREPNPRSPCLQVTKQKKRPCCAQAGYYGPVFFASVFSTPFQISTREPPPSPPRTNPVEHNSRQQAPSRPPPLGHQSRPHLLERELQCSGVAHAKIC